MKYFERFPIKALQGDFRVFYQGVNEISDVIGVVDVDGDFVRDNEC
jgi:hypothetical protein